MAQIMNHVIATAGVGSLWGFIAVFGFLVGGLIAMVVAAIVCQKKKSLKAGIVAIAIMALQGAVIRPWHIDRPFDADDPDQVEDVKDAQVIDVVWFGAASSSVALLVAALLRRRRGPNKAPLRTPASGTPAVDAPVAPPSGAVGR